MVVVDFKFEGRKGEKTFGYHTVKTNEIVGWIY